MNYRLHNGNYVPVEGYVGTILSCGLLIYLHGEVALYDEQSVMTLQGLSGNGTMCVRTVSNRN